LNAGETVEYTVEQIVEGNVQWVYHSGLEPAVQAETDSAGIIYRKVEYATIRGSQLYMMQRMEQWKR